MSEREGMVTTFYSYKGGVGRSFLLANVGWLLARWGRRVLCLDWDLEAPGLHRYLAPDAPRQAGVLDIVHRVRAGRIALWRDTLHEVIGPWHSGGCLHLIPAGKWDEAYHAQLRALDWERLRKRGLSGALEELRASWAAEYDHVLIDSRTGVTDIGGICAAQLPDFLVMVLTANHQSVEGTNDVARRARRTRSTLPVARGGIRLIPVPARLHTGDETLLEAEWQARFEKDLAEWFEFWRDPKVGAREYLTALRVQEYARWSYGEQVPVRTEPLDDPGLVSWSFANLAALLDHQLGDSGRLARERRAYVAESAADSGFGAPERTASRPIDAFIAHSRHDLAPSHALYDALTARGLRVFMDVKSLVLGQDWSEALYAARSRARVIVVLLSGHLPDSPGLQSELEHVLRLHRERSAVIIPVFLDEAGLRLAPKDIASIFGVQFWRGSTWESVADQVADVVERTRGDA